MADILISELPVISGITPDDYVIINDGNVTTAITSFATILASITQVGTVGFADGTESAPAVTFSADPNVGIYRPATDEWAVSTNGNQRLVINQAGSVGIGQRTPGNWNAGNNNLVIGDPSTGDNGLTIVSSSTDVGNIAFSDGTANDEKQVGRIRYDHTDNHMSFMTANAEALRITTNQELLIGTTVPIVGSKIVVDGGNISVPSGTPGNPSLNFATDTDTGVWSAAADHVSVATGGVERATIDDQGHVYLNGDPNTYFYSPDTDEFAYVNNGVETLRLDSDNNIKLSGATPTIYTDQNEMRLSVDADASLAGILAIYMSGTELGRFTNAGMALGTTSNSGIATIGGAPTTGYPTLNLIRNVEENDTTDIALVGNSVIRATNSIRSVVNDNGIFTWSVGGNNYVAGLAGSTEYMRLSADGKLGINTDAPNQELTVNGNIGLVGASAAGTFFSTPVANTVAISTGGTEQFRVGDGGAIGLGGANYGAAGQVLTSGGAGAQPTWTSIATGIPDISVLPSLP